jgi:hypothetical protein
MSVLDALDATRICARWSADLDDPQAWLMAPAPPPASRPSAPEPGYSWWRFLRNPRAMVVAGMVTTMVATDAVLGRR